VSFRCKLCRVVYEPAAFLSGNMPIVPDTVGSDKNNAGIDAFFMRCADRRQCSTRRLERVFDEADGVIGDD
jgi:hypothetical protein